MTNGISAVSSLIDLRDFVQQTICDQQQLLLGAFQFHEKVLIRQGKPCGLHFTLAGPRLVQFSAIWDASRNTVLFYDCHGERLHQSKLAVSAGIWEELAGLS